MATLPSTSYSGLLTAEIRVENLSASPVEQSATISVPTSSPQQQQSADGVGSDEPDKKRPRIDNKEKASPMKVKKLEKLESRLGGILSCSVCLDLPSYQVFQVIIQYIFILHSGLRPRKLCLFDMLVEGGCSG